MSFILDALPTPQVFFREFWNKRPFVVRGMVPADVTESLIDADYLAGLSMEEEVKSRLVRKGEKQSDWACDHGPFEEKDLSELGEKDWSLLVHNIDQYHGETAELLRSFNFSPRWLLDDIMASFSPKGGTVGAHTDSYHVFLVQGEGERRWKVASAPIKDEEYIADISLEILKNSFDGEEVTVSEGDVIYIPPKFAHEGISLKPSLTYSVGFLGPTLSEMLVEFGHYLEEKYAEIPRYLGHNLTESAASFAVESVHIDDFKSFMTDIFDQDIFTKWLLEYFSRPMPAYEDECDDDDEYEDGDEYEDTAFHDEDEDEGEGEDEDEYGDGDFVTDDTAMDIIEENMMLIKPAEMKIMFAPLKAPQKYCVSAGDVSFELDFSDLYIANAMAQEEPFSAAIFNDHIDVLQSLLTRNILKIASFNA